MRIGIPWGVEFDEDIGEFADNSGEVCVGEDENVVLDGVGGGEHEECSHQTYLDCGHH